MTIGEKVSYIKGLAEGLNVDDKVVNAILDVLADIADNLAEVDEELDDVADVMTDLEESVTDLEDEVYGIDDDDEDYDDEDFDDSEDEDDFDDDEDDFDDDDDVDIVESISYKNLRARRLNEENRLDDFGKHPAYQKKVMTLPPNTNFKRDGQYDMNDSSVDGEAPYGQKKGDNAPFSQDIEEVEDAIVESVIKVLKKKLAETKSMY